MTQFYLMQKCDEESIKDNMKNAYFVTTNIHIIKVTLEEWPIDANDHIIINLELFFTFS